MITTELGHFWITFENGYTLSIYNTFGSHSENHFNKEEFDKLTNPKIYDRCESKNCELAVLRDGRFCTRQFIENCEDSVIGYVKPDEVAEIMIKVKEVKE